MTRINLGKAVFDTDDVKTAVYILTKKNTSKDDLCDAHFLDVTFKNSENTCSCGVGQCPNSENTCSCGCKTNSEKILIEFESEEKALKMLEMICPINKDYKL